MSAICVHLQATTFSKISFLNSTLYSGLSAIKQSAVSTNTFAQSLKSLENSSDMQLALVTLSTPMSNKPRNLLLVIKLLRSLSAKKWISTFKCVKACNNYLSCVVMSSSFPSTVSSDIYFGFIFSAIESPSFTSSVLGSSSVPCIYSLIILIRSKGKSHSVMSCSFQMQYCVLNQLASADV